MGTFKTHCVIENISARKKSADVPQMLVDTGSECAWVPGEQLEKIGIKREKKDLAFTMARGQQVTRSVGFAIVRAGEFFTVDEVVFAEPGDLTLLGARSLEGFNALVDPQRKRLIAAGPMPVA